MAVKAWQTPGTTVNIPAITGASVSQSLANAGDAFGNIQKQILAEKELAAQQAFNQEKLDMARQELDWEMGTEKRARDRKSQEAKWIQEAQEKAGGSLIDAFMKTPEAEALMLGRSPEERAKVRSDLLSTNKAAFSDPTVMVDTMRNNLIASGMGYDEASAAAKGYVAEQFPTMDKEIGKSLITALSKGGKGSSSGDMASLGHALKLWQSQADVNDQTQLRNDFMASMGIRPGPDKSYWDIVTDWADLGGQSVNERELALLENMGTSYGLSPQATRVALGQYMDKGGDASFNIEDLSTADFERLILPTAKSFDAQTKKFYDPRTGQDANLSMALENRRMGQLDNVVRRMSPHRYTQKEQLTVLRDILGLPDEMVNAMTGQSPAPKSGTGTGGKAQPSPKPKPAPQQSTAARDAIDELGKRDDVSVSESAGETAKNLVGWGGYLGDKASKNLAEILIDPRSIPEQVWDNTGAPVLEDFLRGFNRK